jgi:Na+/melibiose symporter-like transporter
MLRRVSWAVTSILASALLLMVPEPLLAYGGPGSIISGIGALLAVVAAVFASLLGFVWFPLKRLLRLLRGESRAERAAINPDSREDANQR